MDVRTLTLYLVERLLPLCGSTLELQHHLLPIQVVLELREKIACTFEDGTFSVGVGRRHVQRRTAAGLAQFCRATPFLVLRTKGVRTRENPSLIATTSSG